MLPALVALVCLIAFGVYLAALPYLGFAAGIPGLVVCIVGMAMIFRLPPEAMWWDKGARGERKTAELLDPLQARGFVLRYGLRMPDERGDIDAVAIGPTGVWVVETKNLSGNVSVVGGRLFVKDQPRQAMIDQVYREAFAVQQIVGDLLAPTITMVTPVLCIHGARMLWLDHSVGGVRVVSGRQLTRLMTDRHEVLDAKLVQEIAALVSRKLREPWSWEGEQ